MKISKVIKQLQDILAEEGDLKCQVYDGDGDFIPLSGLSIGMGDTGKPTHLVFCDAETMESFSASNGQEDENSEY